MIESRVTAVFKTGCSVVPLVVASTTQRVVCDAFSVVDQFKLQICNQQLQSACKLIVLRLYVCTAAWLLTLKPLVVTRLQLEMDMHIYVHTVTKDM